MSKRGLVMVVALLLAMSAVSACAPNLRGDADELAERLRELPSVTGVRFDYTKPVLGGMDTGKLELLVRMDPVASTDRVMTVVGEMYEAFRTTHFGEEGDVDLLVGDDRIHVRSFESQPPVEAVVGEARAVFAARDRGALEVDIMAQDVAREDTPWSSNVLTLESGSGPKALLASIPELAVQLGNPLERSWTVAAASGDSIGGEYLGLPSADLILLWQRLRHAAEDWSGVSVALRRIHYPMQIVEVEAPGLDPQADAARIIDVASRQIDLIRRAGDGWSYQLSSDDIPITWVEPDSCSPDVPSVLKRNPVDDALRTPQNCQAEPDPEP